MHSSGHKRVVIVTGASRGLGRSIAVRFGEAGDRVLVNYLTRESDARAVAGEIMQCGGEAAVFRADVGRADEVDAMITEAVNRWGTIDILVNNAGTAKDRLMPRLTEQDWDAVLATNLNGAFHGIRAVTRLMSRQGDGHIINISSIVGVKGRQGQAHYAASKAGLIGLTKAAARELGPFNIKVNAVLPGYLSTDMGEKVPEAVREQVMKENALGRISDANEVAEFICHLSRLNNVSGQVFNLDSRIL